MGREGRREERRDREGQRQKVGVNEGVEIQLSCGPFLQSELCLYLSDLNILNHKVNKAALIGLVKII